MRVLLDNVNLTSRSGPNSFGAQLTRELIRQGHQVDNIVDSMINRTPIRDRPDVHLTFIQANVGISDVPLIQRLDGIYYNSDQQYGDWWTQNSQIRKTYDNATGIIFQSPFSMRLVESFFGEKPDHFKEVIGNGVSLTQVGAVPPAIDGRLDGFDKVWMCASSWRPHKRLAENVRYFNEISGDNDVLLIAGEGIDVDVDQDDIIVLGDLDWNTLVGYYKRADVFIHLGYHDNCPNVVVDARAAGCDIVCAGCAGTRWIAGPDAIVVEEDDWDPQPIELYKPPKLDFSRTQRNGIESSIDITDVTGKYIDFMERFA